MCTRPGLHNRHVWLVKSKRILHHSHKGDCCVVAVGVLDAIDPFKMHRETHCLSITWIVRFLELFGGFSNINFSDYITGPLNRGLKLNSSDIG